MLCVRIQGLNFNNSLPEFERGTKQLINTNPTAPVEHVTENGHSFAFADDDIFDV